MRRSTDKQTKQGALQVEGFHLERGYIGVDLEHLVDECLIVIIEVGRHAT